MQKVLIGNLKPPIASATVAGVVMKSEDVVIASDGKITIDTNYDTVDVDVDTNISNIAKGGKFKTILGNIQSTLLGLNSKYNLLNSSLSKVETYLNGLIIVKAVGADILGSITIPANAASTITKAVEIVDGYNPIAVIPSQSGNNQCYYYSCVLDGNSIIAQIKNCGSESVTIKPQARCIYVKK